MRSEFTCTIDASQAETNLQNPPNSLITMILSDTAGSFAKTAFQVPDEVKREILAVALAAISNQCQVVSLNPTLIRPRGLTPHRSVTVLPT